jgi:hypothetical protein
MDSHNLDKLLSEYKAAGIPRPPANLNQNVWREIRLRQSTPVSSALDYNDFLNWFRRSLTSLVAPALALAIFMSVGLTMLDAQVTPHQRVQQALGLNVFSHQASPLTRLAQNP